MTSVNGGIDLARIGIYGGTFDPVHIGHIQGAKYALQALGLTTLYMVPDCDAPHKQIPDGSPSPQQRYEMLRLALKGEVNIVACDLELYREGVSYSYETVLAFRKMYPQDELFLLMGEDMLLSVESWKNPDVLFRECTLAVLCRGKDRVKAEEKAAQLTDKGVRVQLLDNPVNPISSTQLRRLLAFRCAEPFLPAGVADYIAKNDLYSRNYKDLPMEELERAVISLLNPNRVKHTLGCRDTAAELALLWGADPVDAARAGMLHDVTKALDGPLQLTLCDQYDILLNEFSRKNPKTLHALTGSLVAERIFGENKAVVDAVCSHTTGKAGMNALEKAIWGWRLFEES